METQQSKILELKEKYEKDLINLREYAEKIYSEKGKNDEYLIVRAQAKMLNKIINDLGIVKMNTESKIRERIELHKELLNSNTNTRTGEMMIKAIIEELEILLK